MAVRRREDGIRVGDISPKFPYPYGTDLHWLWGWGHRIEDMIERDDFSPSPHDWITIRACREAEDAMLRFGIEFPLLVQEIKQRQQDVEFQWKKVLDHPSDDAVFAYAGSSGILSARIFKTCELIAERLKLETAAKTPETIADQADREKLFPQGVPKDTDLVDAILRLDSYRTNQNTDIEILRDFTGETPGNCPKAKKLQDRIRKARRDGRTTLPAR